MLSLLFVSTVVDSVPRTRLLKDSPSEISSMLHPREICKPLGPSKNTWFPSFMSRCNIVSVAPFTDVW